MGKYVITLITTNKRSPVLDANSHTEALKKYLPNFIIKDSTPEKANVGVSGLRKVRYYNVVPKQQPPVQVKPASILYEIRTEDREFDEDDSTLYEVTGSYCLESTTNRAEALAKAREYAKAYQNVVIELWKGDDCIDTILDF